MANCMKFEIKFIFKEEINEEIVNAMNVLINNSEIKSSLPNVEFFKKEWDTLFVKYNGYPDFKKIFVFSEINKKYYLEVKIENREERVDLLNNFLEWIAPYIDESTLEDGHVGSFEKDSSYDGASIILSEGKINFIIDSWGDNGFYGKREIGDIDPTLDRAIIDIMSTNFNIDI